MKNKSLFLNAVPEIDQHEVRYSEYLLKSPKTLGSRSHGKRKCLPYGVGPIVDCEIDDEFTKPDFSSYILSPLDIIKGENPNLKVKPKKLSLDSLDSIYTELRKMKLPKIRKIINGSEGELIKVKKTSPDMKYLSLAKQLFSTMFNPDQKYWIYMYVRETLHVPPHEFNKYLYEVLAPEAALIVFQKKYKISTKMNAAGKLAELELLNPSFYDNKALNDIHSRT